MNPLVAQQLKEIAGGLNILKQELARQRQNIDEITTVRNTLQQKLWSQSRELSVLREGLQSLEQIQNENQKYRILKQNMEKQLRAILKLTQTLTIEFQK